MEIAKVIVDVPTMQTNQPYDYVIPQKLQQQLRIGFRVVVPFGTRLRQGFVVDIVRESHFSGDLKAIEGVIDVEPVLSSELILLGSKMAEELFAFRIHCYQTMLPPVLKAKYEKSIVPTEFMPMNLRQQWFGQQDTLDWSSIQEQHTATFLNFRKKGYIDVVYHVRNRARVAQKKQVHWLVNSNQAQQLMQQLPANAHKLQALLQYRATYPEQNTEWVQTVQRAAGVSLATMHSAVKKGWLQLSDAPVYRDPYAHVALPQTDHQVLTQDQQQAFNAVYDALRRRQAQTFLLQGVTGSGKTEVYLQLIAEALKQQQTALLLVPEIALTPQMVRHFKGRFGNRVAVLHSALSEGEKYDEWRRIREGKADIVVGARSSVFAPLNNIGIIIIDEEHEATYKQEDTPRYHARQIAQCRSQYHHCPLVLGSATPSLESRARAHKGVYRHVLLPQRVNQKPLPPVTLVDMREEHKSGNFGELSQHLQQKIADRLARKEQIVLLLNHRGYSSFVMCRDCGYVLPCPNCDISLTMHLDNRVMKCHYCGHEQAIPTQCTQCYSRDIRYYGSGTQKVEETLNALFPQARIVRMDVDTTRKKGQHERLLTQFGAQQADILLGTQMIAKGLDFPNVTLVGVINADTALHVADFRSFEKTFQLLTQVSGRAGRGALSGEVLIQTYNPEHYAIELAQQHDYERFYAKEMQLRHLGQYPPYYFTALLTVSHSQESLAMKAAYAVHQLISQLVDTQTIILGPTKKSIARIKQRYYFQVLLKYKNSVQIKEALAQVLEYAQQQARHHVHISVDIEPTNFI